MLLVTKIALAVAQVLYLFAPLLVASALMAAVLRFDLVPSLKRPVDAGRMLRGRRLLGDGKTWRGFVVAIVGCVVTVVAQKHLRFGRLEALALVDYAHVDPLVFGSAMGAGAMVGELPNSFVKRRLGIPAGSTTGGPLSVLFYVWDQVDLLTTAWPAVAVWVRTSALLVATSFAVALALHPTISLVGYLIGARKSAR